MYHNHCIKHSHPQPTKYTKMISFTNLSLILVNYSLLSNELANNIAICFIYYVLKFDICRSTISYQIDCPSKLVLWPLTREEPQCGHHKPSMVYACAAAHPQRAPTDTHKQISTCCTPQTLHIMDYAYLCLNYSLSHSAI